jgi:hypothetical protein
MKYDVGATRGLIGEKGQIGGYCRNLFIHVCAIY